MHTNWFLCSKYDGQFDDGQYDDGQYVNGNFYHFFITTLGTQLTHFVTLCTFSYKDHPGIRILLIL